MIAVSVREADVYTVLRSWLMSVLLPDVSVVQGQVNRVPTPTGSYVVMTPIMRLRLATSVDTFGYGQTAPTTSTSVASTQFGMQLDVHGPGASDNCQIISTLFRDLNACDFFAASGLDITPLYTGDPRQMPFINGERQYEDRWTIDVHMQINPVLTVPQQYADQADVDLISVDATYF